MRELILSQGLTGMVDDDVYETEGLFKWYALKSNRTYYIVRAIPHPDGGSNKYGKRQKWIRLHTVITGWARVDHKDGNGLNCLRDNLRPATSAQNAANRRINVNNKTGYKGVAPYRNGYRAKIGFHGSTRHIGIFNDPVTAAFAYDDAARKYYGEFAHPNFIWGSDDLMPIEAEELISA